MQDLFRVVLDPRGLQGYIISKHGSAPPIIVGSTSFRTLSAVVGIQSDHQVESNPGGGAFLKKLLEHGVIDRELTLQGTVDVVPSQYHLRSVQIETLLRCNLSCGYCYCGAHKDRPEQLTTEEIKTIIDDCGRLGVLSIDFTGGEFLLYRNWDKLITSARSRGMSVTVHTNGTALNEKNVAILEKCGIERVQVSFDSHLPDLHDKVRGLKGSHNRALSGLSLLRKAGIPTKVAIMVHKANLGDIADTVRFFRQHADVVSYDWIAPFGLEGDKSEYGVSAREFFEATQALRRDDYVKFNQRPCGRDIGRAPNDYEPDCGIGYSYIFITAQGEMAICPTLTSRESVSEFNGPNLRDIGLYSAWNSHPYFDKYRFENCENVQTCSAGQSCRGGCRANAYAQSGGYIRAPNMIECNERKNVTGQYIDFSRRYAEKNFAPVLATADVVSS